MEGEMLSLMRGCIIVVVSLVYCYLISSKIPKGNIRLISLLPVISIFTFIPLLFSSFLLQYYSGLFIWLAISKLILFAFGKDETLTVYPSMPLLDFIVITAFPIKIKRNHQNPPRKGKLRTALSNLIMWYVTVRLYVAYKQHTSVPNTAVINLLYSFRFFFGIQIYFVIAGAIAKFLLKKEIEEQFGEPALATSLQNFWGRRWNLMVSGALKSTIYEPTRTLFTPLLGRRGALHPAMLTTFFVSGLIHELVYFYVRRQKPTWEVTTYFLIHGVCVSIEVEAKKRALQRGWKLNPLISTLFTAGFVLITGTCLCFGRLIRSGADAREINEYMALGDYIMRIIH